jgi:hypothetical protein
LKRFVVPPDWPTPPRRSWVPPKTWRPDPSWPEAPDDWQFWVDGKGEPVRGPIGLYAGPSQRTVIAGAGALVLTLGVVFWALSAVGLFGGGGDDTAAHIAGDDASTTPSASRTPVVPPKLPTVTPSARKPTPTPTPLGATAEPTRRPTPTRTSSQPKPTPTKTTTTVKPSRPTTTKPSTEEEALRQYCVQRGWPAEWCDPDNWNSPSDDPRNNLTPN